MCMCKRTEIKFHGYLNFAPSSILSVWFYNPSNILNVFLRKFPPFFKHQTLKKTSLGNSLWEAITTLTWTIRMTGSFTHGSQKCKWNTGVKQSGFIRFLFFMWHINNSDSTKTRYKSACKNQKYSFWKHLNKAFWFFRIFLAMKMVE